MVLYSIVYCTLSTFLYLFLFYQFGDATIDFGSIVFVGVLCFLPCISMLEFFGLNRKDRPIRKSTLRLALLFGMSFSFKALLVYGGETYHSGYFFVGLIVEYLLFYGLVFVLMTEKSASRRIKL